MSLQIMCPVTEKDIQEHVRLRLEAERKEKELRKKEKLEAHLFTVVKLVRDSDIQEQIGSVRWFDLAGTDKVSNPSGKPTLKCAPATSRRSTLGVATGMNRSPWTRQAHMLRKDDACVGFIQRWYESRHGWQHIGSYCCCCGLSRQT